MAYRTMQDITDARYLLSPPGDTLAETLVYINLTQKELSRRMGRPEKTISEIINGKAAITAETAIEFENVLGTPATFWMERERRYRLELAEIEQAEKMMQQKDWLKKFPCKELATHLSWPSDYLKDIVGTYRRVLRFFKVADKEAFESHYLLQLNNVAYRKSESQVTKEYALASWLRLGEIEVEAETDWPSFDKKKLVSILPSLKEVMSTQPEDFFTQAQLICKSAGVKLVASPLLPGAPVNGCARVYQKRYVIQLSDRYKRYDILWFTLFHEIGHLLLHVGSKDMLVVDMQGVGDNTSQMEKEANDFAVKWTFNLEDERRLLQINKRPTLQNVEDFAISVGTHPSLIVGRLRRNKIVPQSYGQEYLTQITLQQ